MTDESESGEAYDKIANQRRRPTKSKRQTKRRDQIDPALEAKIVRAVMSGRTTFSQLARQVELKPEILQSQLKRLGLDEVTSRNRAAKRCRARRLKLSRTVEH